MLSYIVYSNCVLLMTRILSSERKWWGEIRGTTKGVHTKKKLSVMRLILLYEMGIIWVEYYYCEKGEEVLL